MRPVGGHRVQRGARALGGPNTWSDRDNHALSGGDWLKDGCQDRRTGLLIIVEGDVV